MVDDEDARSGHALEQAPVDAITGETPSAAVESRHRGLSRRSILIGAAGVGISSVGIAAAVRRGDGADRWLRETGGAHQRGVDHPDVPPLHSLLTAYVIADDDLQAMRATLPQKLQRMGELALEWMSGQRGRGTRDVIVSFGLGPRVISAIDPNLPGAADLPSFVGDDGIAPGNRGGDVLIAVYGDRADQLADIRQSIEGAGERLERHWAVDGVRPAGAPVRNALGFHDELTNPRSGGDRAQIWIPNGPAAGGTICVVRLLGLDDERFAELPPERRDAIIGRRQSDGAPLSGGSRQDPADLLARNATGELLIPDGAHIRAARAPYSHRRPMLRRSYRTAVPTHASTTASGVAMLFVSYQRSLGTFISTQQRLDRSDALMSFVTPLLSATFLVAPGFDAHRPLGSFLFERSRDARG